MTDPTVEAVAMAIYTKWYESPLSGTEKKKIDPPPTWEEVVAAFNSHGAQYPEISRIVRLARLEATAAIEALKALGWAPPECLGIDS